MPREAAEPFYLIGLSYNEFKLYKHAVDALSDAIKVDPKHYQVKTTLSFISKLYCVKIRIR